MSVNQKTELSVAQLLELSEQTKNSLKAKLAIVQSTIAEQERYIRVLDGAAVPPDEMKRRFRAQLGAIREAWLKDSGAALIGIHTNGIGSPTLAGAARLPANLTSLEAMCVSSPDVILAHVDALIDEIAKAPGFKCGPPLSERPALMADALQKRDAAEAEEEALIVSMISIGIVVERRPAAAQRLAKQQRDRESEPQRRAAFEAARAKNVALYRMSPFSDGRSENPDARARRMALADAWASLQFGQPYPTLEDVKDVTAATYQNPNNAKSTTPRAPTQVDSILG